MATAKSSKAVSVVRRNGESTITHAAPVRTKKSLAVRAEAKASRRKEQAPLFKKKVITTVVPTIKREEPHVLKRDEGKPLVERLNPKLRAQLRDRKVTNEAAAEALGVSATYLSRTLSELGEEKAKGATTAHREARSELNAVREKHRSVLAKKVNKGEMTIEKAAKDANCSVRTMFRWCAKYDTGRAAA